MSGTDRSWGEYRLGLTVVGVLTVIVVSVLLMGSQRGPFLPSTVPYYLELDDAAGLRIGSFVRVGGVSAGEVRDIEIVPPASPATIGPADGLPALSTFRPAPNIRIELAVDERFRPHITESSRAQLANLGLGGERYVSISAGDVRQPVIPVRGTIGRVASADWDIILGKVSRALNEARVLVATVNEMRAEMRTGSSSAGRLLDSEAELYVHLGNAVTGAERLIDLVEQGPGFVARARSDSTLGRTVTRVREDLGILDSIHGEEATGLTRWSDPRELEVAVSGLASQVATLRMALETGHGTIGRLAYDRELQQQLRVLERRIADLTEAIRENPLGYIDIDLF